MVNVMGEYNPKQQKNATDDQDRFQEVSICLNLPQQKESNVEEELKELSMPLKAMKTVAKFCLIIWESFNFKSRWWDKTNTSWLQNSHQFRSQGRIYGEGTGGMRPLRWPVAF